MRILFADDSMTAQNMGKKILTEAGYEVVAVSNGAAAVKKIAEQKPDIIILDIYMPGYTGLEVCDKVRSSVETLKTPVLLTVGKMEPYRAEDANRVKADGVIIKPFEASDLLAVIKKLEERVAPRTVAVADQTIRLESLPEAAEFAPEVSHNHAEMQVEVGDNTAPAIVDVPDNMATSAAFSDLLGPEPVHSFEPTAKHTPAAELLVTPEPSVEPPVPISLARVEAPEAAHEAVEIPEFTTLPSENFFNEMPSVATPEQEFGGASKRHEETSATLTREEFELEEASFPAAIPETASPEPAVEVVHEDRVSSIPDTQPIPVYQEHEPQPREIAAPETPVSVSAPSDIASARLEHWVVEELPSTAEPEKSGVPVEPPMPAKSSLSEVETEDFDSFSARVDSKIDELETLVSASEERHIEMDVEPPAENGFGHSTPTAKVTASPEDDFEARVAAAMSIYDEPAEGEIAAAPAIIEPEPVAGATGTAKQVSEPASFHTVPDPVVEHAENSVEASNSFEYSPPVIAPASKIVLEPKEEPVAQKADPLLEIPDHIEPAVLAAKPELEVKEGSRGSSHQGPSPVVGADPVPVSIQVDDEKIISEIEAQLPVASVAPGDSVLDTQAIAQAVHRVLERLKPHLIEEISRELKNK